MSLMDLEAIPCECLSCDGKCPHTSTNRSSLCDNCEKGDHNVPAKTASQRVSVPTN